MAKLPINSFLLLLRRSYAVAAENVRVQAAAASVMKTAVDSGSLRTEISAEDEQKEIFWMRDPKTGCWIPESHFDEIDVAELREKFLSKKRKILS